MTDMQKAVTILTDIACNGMKEARQNMINEIVKASATIPSLPGVINTILEQARRNPSIKLH